MDENKQLPVIADTIKKYRKERQATQEQLCEASDISISTLKKYESGVRNPKPDQLQKTADALGVSVNVFMPLEVRDMSSIKSSLNISTLKRMQRLLEIRRKSIDSSRMQQCRKKRKKKNNKGIEKFELTELFGARDDNLTKLYCMGKQTPLNLNNI